MTRSSHVSAALIIVALVAGSGARARGQTAAPARASGALSLADAVSEALVYNDRILNQHDSIEQADLGVRLAKNGFRPKVVPNMQGSLGQTDVSNQSYRLDLSQRLKTGTE